MKLSISFLSPLAFMFVSIMPLVSSAQIIADHRVVDDFDKIPQSYIDEVKKMWVIVAGESHSLGYRIGCQLLENSDPRFQVNIKESGTPEGYTDQYMRLSRATWGDLQNATGWRYSYGEEDWFTSPVAISRTRDHLTYCNTHDLQVAAMGFGWCWDMTADNGPGGTVDPVYQVRWAGRTVGGPEGSLRWGLDNNDQLLTGNSVCMDTYLHATEEYMTHCQANGYPTKIFFTTGPVDGNGNLDQSGYQRSIKHQYMKDFVSASTDRVLFDYADILCWSNAGDQKTTSWTDVAGNAQSFQVIHDDNMLDLDGSYAEDGDHIGERGALRLAKAMWWMLARMAGWDGNTLGTIQPEPECPFQIYPNPVEDVLSVSLSIGNPGFSLTLSDMTGKELLKQQIVDAVTDIDITNLTSGVYLVSIQQDHHIELRKIIKL